MVRSVKITPDSLLTNKYSKPGAVLVSGTDVYVAGFFSENVTINAPTPVTIPVPGIGIYNGFIIKLAASSATFSYVSHWTKFNDNYQYGLIKSPDGSVIGIGSGSATTKGLVAKFSASTLTMIASFTAVKFCGRTINYGNSSVTDPDLGFSTARNHCHPRGHARHKRQRIHYLRNGISTRSSVSG